MADATRFSHLDERGTARMVDVSAKPVTRRVARASCLVRLSAETLSRLHELPKGDALAVARVAGVQAAKRTADWIPLAHPLPLDRVAIEFATVAGGLRIESEVVATARTGAEMEALVACSAAALALYDMVKAVERGAEITDLRLEAKSGGVSGDWNRGA
ncbi:MAG: cyclic pyranopterin monophosphate synthase MoaC [Thermoanaerobaculia bacterium]|nr:cyclic pyranopterin monophosphate synthase MoaC [Thermoanaerobaculia bacterium]